MTGAMSVMSSDHSPLLEREAAAPPPTVRSRMSAVAAVSAVAISALVALGVIAFSASRQQQQQHRQQALSAASGSAAASQRTARYQGENWAGGVGWTNHQDDDDDDYDGDDDCGGDDGCGGDDTQPDDDNHDDQDADDVPGEEDYYEVRTRRLSRPSAAAGPSSDLARPTRPCLVAQGVGSIHTIRHTPPAHPHFRLARARYDAFLRR